MKIYCTFALIDNCIYLVYRICCIVNASRNVIYFIVIVHAILTGASLQVSYLYNRSFYLTGPPCNESTPEGTEPQLCTLDDSMVVTTCNPALVGFVTQIITMLCPPRGPEPCKLIKEAALIIEDLMALFARKNLNGRLLIIFQSHH